MSTGLLLKPLFVHLFYMALPLVLTKTTSACLYQIIQVDFVIQRVLLHSQKQFFIDGCIEGYSWLGS